MDPLHFLSAFIWIYSSRVDEVTFARSGANRLAGSEDEARITKPPLLTNKYTIYALLFLIAGVFPTEYFVSIEPMRFLFIWVILSEQVNGFGQRFVETLKALVTLSPHLAGEWSLAGIFLYDWRIMHRMRSKSPRSR